MTQRNDLISTAPLSVLFLALNFIFYAIEAYQARNFGSIDTLTLLNMGGSMRELMWEGQWVRLVAPNVLHVHLLHIALNSMSLYQMGPAMEKHFGSSNFGTICVVSGICGFAFSQIFGANLAAGASASIFGLLGAQLMVQAFQLPILKHAWRNKEVRESSYLILFYFALGWSGMMGPIDNWAHLGGFIFGALFAAMFEVWRTRRRLGAGMLGVALLSTAIVICAARWSVFNPYYHLHMAVLAQEQKKPEPEIEKHLSEARRWAAKWGSGKRMELLIAGHAAGEWNIEHARTYGYRVLGEVTDRMARGE